MYCKSVRHLKIKKGLNRLGGGLSADAITEKDLSDLQVIIDLDLEYVAVSFPACGSDLDPVKMHWHQLNQMPKL